MLKIIKSKKGITLVELIVGMVVLAIILATASAILLPMMRFQARANELAEQNYLLDSLANQIIYDLSMATKPIPLGAAGSITLPDPDPALVITIPVNAGGPVTYDIEAGVIMRAQGVRENGTPYRYPLLPPEFHQRMNEAGLSVDTIELSVDTTDGRVYTLELTLSNDDNLRFSRPYAVRPLALIHNS